MFALFCVSVFFAVVFAGQIENLAFVFFLKRCLNLASFCFFCYTYFRRIF